MSPPGKCRNCKDDNVPTIIFECTLCLEKKCAPCELGLSERLTRGLLPNIRALSCSKCTQGQGITSSAAAAMTSEKMNNIIARLTELEEGQAKTATKLREQEQFNENLMKELKELEEARKREREEFDSVKKELDSTKNELATLKARLATEPGIEVANSDNEGAEGSTNNEEPKKQSWAQITNNVSRAVMDQVKNQLDEFKAVKRNVQRLVEDDDKARRAKNFVLMGVPEDEEKDISKRKDGERKYIKEMLEIMGLKDDVVLEESVRLGKYDPTSTYTRVLRVTVGTEKQKWSVVGKGRHLKSSVKFGKVFVQPDLNQEDRKKERKIVDELKEQRKNQPAKNWTIKKGKVIEVSKPQGNQQSQQAQTERLG